ncbi:ABC transporter substrate-binding protein [Pantoea allii]|uniref:ABC transporter substrate-binding protein n=1 Tax=Pantoea allii TaxID=574096 RepID=UPI003D26B3CC
MLNSDSFMKFWLRTLLLLSVTISTLAWGKTITDINGTRVTVPDHPQRIVLGESRMLYTFAMLEAGNPFKRLVGWPQDLKKYDRQTWDIFAHQFPEMLNIPSIGLDGTNDINPERVIALKPDVVILPELARSSEAGQRLEAVLKAANIPVVKIDLRVHLLQNTTRSVAILGEVLNQRQRATAFNQFYQQHMQTIQQRLAGFQGHKPTVLLQLHLGRRNECCVTAVNGSLGDVLSFAGGDNIASKKVPGVFGRLNEETVITANPDYYFATGSGGSDDASDLRIGPAISQAETRASLQQLTAQQNGLKQLRALHNGHAAAMWHNFYLSPWHVAAAEFFAKTLYPDLFNDVNPEQTLRQIFSDFLPVPYSGTYFYSLKKESQ